MDDTTENLRAALKLGDPAPVAALIAAGADVRYRDENGMDALMDAVYGRSLTRDTRLIALLTLLIQSGASLDGVSSYGETALRRVSDDARFDAVRLLLAAGADPALGFTGLMKAVAFGSLADVASALRRGSDLEAQDSCGRTSWLVAIQTGDIPKAQLLMAHGASADTTGRFGRPALFHAITGQHPPMMQWLLESGADVHLVDSLGMTPLAVAADSSDAEAVKLLLEAGADPNQTADYRSALSHADTREAAILLMEAGADPAELSTEGRRAILGYPSEPDQDLLDVSPDDFRRFRSPRFGRKNPERMNNPFWEGMIRAGVNAYRAAVKIEGKPSYAMGRDPVWCADRFGQSLTFLPDGRIIQIAGEHEDSYDPDFCIYNDVFVHDGAGGVTIYGYPKSVFPPTDSHTATLIGGHIYLIGSIGYQGTRQPDVTPVYRLDTTTFRMERLETTGDNPGWLYKHRAERVGDHAIRVTGGKIATGERSTADNATPFVLDIESLTWTRETPPG